ncbi:MAG: hypothetical protein NVSMB64_14850 [Candidatus Velthaea sp.]
MIYRRILLIALAIGLLACAYVAARRVHHEAQARNVEIVLDDADFSLLARAYNYDQPTFLRALKDAGVTSLGVAEELGSAVSSSSEGAVYAGATLIAQSRLAPFADPLFARLARTQRLRPDEMYLIAFDAPTAQRYRTQLAIDFSPKSVHVLRATLPAVFAIRTESEYFQSVGLGVPAERMDMDKRLGMVLAPRLENDERFGPERIDKLVESAIAGHRVRTLIFFGLRNQVLGYPANIDAAAETFKRTKLNFGAIETYDVKLVQAGTDELARKIPGQIVRVQAISKTEQDKLKPQEIIARYLLGVRERNIRVVYLRPYTHEWDAGTGLLSIEKTNVEIVKRLAEGIRKDGYRLGGASPIYPFVVQPWLILAASLAVPAMLLLLLDALGIRGYKWLIALVGLDLLLVVAGYAVHHDMAVRKLLALGAGVLFPVAAIATIAPDFRGEDRVRALGAALTGGLRVLAMATLVALAGALVIVGLLSTPLTMTEIDRFTGVKLVLLLPPLVALALYVLTPLWDARLNDPVRAAAAPVRFYQLALGIAIIGGAYVLQARSGNQSDIAPSSFELALRSHLTSILSVRPRFKEFLIGFPAMMLLPALLPADRKRIGWLIVLALGIGLGDAVDTFSHLHTPLGISVLRLINGAVLGAVAGAVAIVVYRRLRVR